jgi:hypothetical protein
MLMANPENTTQETKLLSLRQLGVAITPRMPNQRTPTWRWMLEMAKVLPFVQVPGAKRRYYLLEPSWQWLCAQMVYPAQPQADGDPRPHRHNRRADDAVDVSRIRRALVAEVLDGVMDQTKRRRGRPRKAREAFQPTG